MITKRRFIDSVLVLCSGGKPTAESSVWREDIEAYLPLAVNYVQLKQYYINIKDDNDRTVPGAFISTHKGLAIEKDEDRGCSVITLPYLPISMHHNGGIRFVGYENGVGFVGGEENDQDIFIYNKKHGNEVPTIQIEGIKIYIYNVACYAETAMVKMIANVDILNDDDILPLPGGLELEAIQVCYELATGQRFAPRDKINDGQDNIQ